MTQYLFVYGTLDPERAPSEIAHAVARLSPVGEASVPGVLYDFGEYPGAVFNQASKRKIFGRVFRIPDDPKVLRQLDEYEGFAPSDTDNSLFVRELRPVKLAGGRTLPCWVYVYNRPPGNARQVRGGALRRRRSRSVARDRAAS